MAWNTLWKLRGEQYEKKKKKKKGTKEKSDHRPILREESNAEKSPAEQKYVELKNANLVPIF